MAEITDKSLPFRGVPRAAIAHGDVIVFVTTHEEGRPTAIYSLDVDKGELAEAALGSRGGAVSIAADDRAIYVGCEDRTVVTRPLAGGKIAPLGGDLGAVASAIALVAGDRIAVVAGAEVLVMSRKSGAIEQRLPLGDAGTAIATDASGAWIAAGSANGELTVFETADKTKGTFARGSSKKIHEGQISALIFDPDEPRVYSAGADNRVLSTHVRGELEPEDRTGGAALDGMVRAFAIGVEDKLYTTGADGALRTWSRSSKRKPATTKEAQGNALVRVAYKGRPHVAILCEDRTIRLMIHDAGGKIGERSFIFRDAYALAKAELGQREPSRREAALEALAGYDDARAIEIIAAQASEDPDHALKVKSVKLLGATKNPRVRRPLEDLLNAPEEQVRLAALAGLRAFDGERALGPLDLALGKWKRDLGVAAVTALASLARSDDLAMARLIQALDDDPAEVRAEALTALEQIVDEKAGKASPEASLTALAARRADIRRLALVRAHRRGLSGEPSIAAALRRHGGDTDADVRRAALLVSIAARPALADALRGKDKDIARQLDELDGKDRDKTESKDEAPAAAAPKRPKKTKEPKEKDAPPPPMSAGRALTPLSEEDLRPLFEAMASRALDTCLAGARALASLHDQRAFGTLLQLTGDRQNSARVDAARALAELGDPRAADRLRQMLRDSAPEVRDAAFSSLVRLEELSPLRAAEAGLLVPADDVRARALSVVIAELKKDKGSAPALALLERALNDGGKSVRSEAFKAALTLDVGGGAAGTIRFALRSIHADIRKEALGEVVTRSQEAWAPALFYEIFGDPDASVRAEAFDAANKRSKGKALEPLAAALACKHADLRRRAVEALSKRRFDGARELLVRACGDEDAAVRIGAALALDIEEASQALDSQFADVRSIAALARAAVGDPKALAPLLSLITEKEPDREGERAGWVERTVRALAGLAELGEARADVAAAVAALINHKDKSIRDMASRALAWVTPLGSGGDVIAPLRSALAHSDADVKREAALGLAVIGLPDGLPVLKGLSGSDEATALRALGASLALGDAARDIFTAFLDHNAERVRSRALLLTMLVEAGERDGVPDRCLAALASVNQRVRLVAARALEAFGDERAFSSFVTELVNDRGEGRAAFTVPEATANAIACALAHGGPKLKLRTIAVISALDDEKQERFDKAWAVYALRFEREIAEASARRDPAPLAYTHDDLQRVVLGAYAGLSRATGGALEVRVQKTAVARLTAMARDDKPSGTLRGAVKPVLFLALGDPNKEVRRLAFDSLLALGVDAAEIGAEALAVGHRDIGALGLDLLGKAGAGKARAELFEDVLVRRTDGLEEEAGKLLAADVGWVKVHALAIGAASQPARERALTGLAELYPTSDEAKAALAGALGSRHKNVRDRAAVLLAEHKDAKAFDALAAMLRTDAQAQAIDALVRLGDARAPSVLLDRVADDPAGDAMVSKLFNAAGAFRSLAVADRLLAQLAVKKYKNAAFDALLMVSGYDQPIDDPNDERPEAPKARDEHPRRDDLLARMVDAAYRAGDADLLGRMLPRARWAKGNELNVALAPLATSSKDDLRDAAVEALGFRLQKRGGSEAPLVAALGARSPTTQFLAAEGLALAGRAEGIRVLLTAVDLAADLGERRRAVRALGVLADARALDLLLKLAGEDGHALQENAAEAIGRMKETPRADAIEKLLTRLAAGSGGVAVSALIGLRWFGTRAAWAAIRGRINDEAYPIRLKVAELLGFDQDAASRAALVDLLATEVTSAVAMRAAESLRRLDGPTSIEPEYVLVTARVSGLGARTIERLAAEGDPGRVLDLFPTIQPHNQAYTKALTTALIGREPPPLAEAAARLDSVHHAIAEAAARILARAGGAASSHRAKLSAALDKAFDDWSALRRESDRRSGVDLGGPTGRLVRLIEAAGRLGTGAARVIAASSLGGDDAIAAPIRVSALRALALGFAGDAGLDALAGRVRGDNARERSIAASALRALSKERAAAVAAGVLDDPITLAALLGSGAAPIDAMRSAAGNVHVQGSIFRYLVAARDTASLRAAVADKKLGEPARLGAIEALASIADDAAFEALRAVGTDEGEDEEVRKAAWRALRRGKRYGKRLSAPKEVTP